MKKRKLNALIKSANEVLSQTKYTKIVWQVYANSAYVLDTEEDNVIEVCTTEVEAMSVCKGIDKESGCKTECYYKPILIDKDSGERITRKNLKHYLIK